MRKGQGPKTACRMIGRMLGLLALGMLITGCDRCGDGWWSPDQAQSCKNRLPPR